MFYHKIYRRTDDLERGAHVFMLRFIILAMVAAAIVVGFYSGSVSLALAALCGACGVTTLLDAPSPMR